MKYDPTMSREELLDRYDELHAEIARMEKIIDELKVERNNIRQQLGTKVLPTGVPLKAERISTATRMPRGETTRLVLQALHTGPATTREIMETTNLSYGQVQMTLVKGREQNLVRQRQDKYWELAVHKGED